MGRFVDLSHDIVDGMVTYPNLPAPRLSTVLAREASRGRYDDGVEFHIGAVELCTNTGTYLDTPFHRFADGHDLTGLALSSCVDLPLVLVDAPTDPAGPAEVPPDALDRHAVAGAAVLFRTGWSARWGTSAYLEPGHPYLGAAIVDRLVASGAALVGIDALNIDGTSGGARPAHTGLLAAGIPIVEHLTNLEAVPEVGARFTAVPVKVSGLGTFPVRAFATLAQRPAVYEIVMDCHDVEALSRFWAAAVRGQAEVRSAEWAYVRDHRAGGVLLGLQRVPEAREPKTTKNRVHLDLHAADIATETARLVALGATTMGELQQDETGRFQVLRDPEGNEFCLVD